MKKHLWDISYYLILFTFTFTAYVLLDTSVITRIYTYISSETPSTVSDRMDSNEESAEKMPKDSLSDAIISGDSNSNIEITLTEYREYDTAIYVADVQVSSAVYFRLHLPRTPTEKMSLKRHQKSPG